MAHGVRKAFKPDTTGPNDGVQRKDKGRKVPKRAAKIPKDKGRPKRKKVITFNSPKTTKISY